MRALGFGLVTLSVGITSAADHEGSLATLCRAGHDPVRVQRRAHCPACDGPPDPALLCKGRPAGGGSFVVLEPGEVDAARAAAKAAAERAQVAVHPAAEVERDTFPVGSAWYLAPGRGCDPHAYAAMVALVARERGKAFVVPLEFPDGGGPPLVTTILSGPGALSRRVGGRFGAWLEAIANRLREGDDRRPARVSFAVVKGIGSAVELSVAKAELETDRLEAWTRDHLIGRLPGAGDAPE